MYVLVYFNQVYLNKRNIVCIENFQRNMYLINELFKCILKKIYVFFKYSIIKCNKKVKR